MQHLNQLTEKQLCGLSNAKQEGKDILPRPVVCPLGAVYHVKKKQNTFSVQEEYIRKHFLSPYDTPPLFMLPGHK